MKARDYTGWVLMLAAAGFGIGAFFLIRHYLSGEEQRLRDDAQRSQGRMARVVVAARDLEPGAVIDAQTMAVGEIPQRHRSARALLPEDFARVERRVLGRPMSAGEPLLEDFVSGLRVERFSDLLAPGMRALSLEVSALESHAGLLLPGDHIDLFVLLAREDGRRERRLLGLIERVQVLAAGEQPLRSAEQRFQPLRGDGAGYGTITIALPDADAERALRARRAGELVYLLRGAQDERLRFDQDGIARFEQDRPAPTAGYAYYSGAVPRGERRGRRQAAAAGPEPELAAGMELEDEPLPLDVLFKNVPRPDEAAAAGDENRG